MSAALMAFDGAEDIRSAWLRGLAPDPAQTVSQWADSCRYLSTRASAEAGRWRTARTPYLRAIMDELSPQSAALRVVFMKAAQVGATEAGNNWLGYVMHRTPGPFLMVQPTTEMARRVSVQRIEPLIEESAELRALVAPSRSRDSGNTILSKKFPGGVFVLTGANSAAGLRSMSARFVFLDEIDAYPGDVDGEGDPITVVEARSSTFGHRRKMLLASTPTVRGASRIEREWEGSDQRRYHVPCPHCGTVQWLKFERLRWPKGMPDRARYVCEGCEQPIEERHKPWFMDEANGAHWAPTAEAETLERARLNRVAGFHLSALYSPLGWKSWGEIAASWEAAQGNDSELKAVKNTVLGELWQERGEAPDWQRLYERREGWSLGSVPEGVLFLTAGADVQRDRIEVDVWGWGRGLRSWLVDHIVLHGDPGGTEVWERLTAILSQTWPHAGGQRMGLRMLAIDTGDGMTTQAVYGWVRHQSREQVMAVKGASNRTASAPVDGPSYVEVTAQGRKIKRGVALWTVAVSSFKGELYRFLRLAGPTDEDVDAGSGWPPGYVHLPRGITSEWVQQLTAEHLVTVKGRSAVPRLEWKKLRERNEALDCRVYARAAAWLIGADRFEDLRWQQLEIQLDPPQAAPGEAEPPPAGRTDVAPRRRRLAASGYVGGR